MTSLVELNDFVKAPNGVWCAKHNESEFHYSDGQQVEQVLHRVLTEAVDLSSDSKELEQQIVDWPTEYHLSSVRANLLRALDLTSVHRVLELGCGCGSITRYLGEQPHIEVDAVEGSEVRAALAAQRCRDLANVTISTANFNDVSFPENYYDLVLFVGVTEYAGRFSEAESDQQALQELLALAHRAGKDDAVTLVAIENRTGLKYMMGANEDHYGVPYIGISDYPESTGIRTYTQREWQQQILQSDFTYHTFLYPFPDYKIPTLVVSDHALQTQPASTELAKTFSAIKSRDYLSDFDLGEQEATLWDALYQTGLLGALSNSFVILLGQDQNKLQSLVRQDVMSFHDPDLKQLYLSDSNNKPTRQPQSINEISHQRELNQLKHQVRHLQNQLNLVEGSRGWRCLQRVRGLFNVFSRKR